MSKRKLPDIEKLDKLAKIRPIADAKKKLNDYHKSLYGFAIPKIGGIGVRSCVKVILEQAEKEPISRKPTKPPRKTKKQTKASTVDADNIPEHSVLELQDKVKDVNRKFLDSNTYVEYYKPMYCTVEGQYYPINETLWNWILVTDNWYACPHMYPYFSENVHKGIQSILHHIQKNDGLFKVRVGSGYHIIQI